MGLLLCRFFNNKNMADFNADRTIIVSGVSKFINEGLTKYFQSKNNSGPARDVSRVYVCPEGKDCVLIEFAKQSEVNADKSEESKEEDKITLRSNEVEINGTSFKVQPYSSSTSIEESVSKIWPEEEVKIQNGQETEDGGGKGRASGRDETTGTENETSSFSEETTEHKHDEEITVHPYLVRYIVTYHYKMYQALEDVSAEIRFCCSPHEQFSTIQTKMKITAKSSIDETVFREVFENFISAYKKLYQSMVQENISINLPTNCSILDEIVVVGAKFSVVTFFREKDSLFTVYGEKNNVGQASIFINKKFNIASNADGGSSSKIISRRSNDVASSNASAGNKAQSVKQLSYDLSKKVKLLVYQGDITVETVDAIVNPANENLRHSGGAAEAIVKRGGTIIQTESDNVMRRLGKPLQPGQVEITKSGNLPCHFIVHAVGPRWNNHIPSECRTLLHKAVINSLNIANTNLAQAIAIPAISSGIFDVPVRICAEVLFNAVEEYAKTSKDPGYLKEIRFVNIDKATVKVFEQEIRKRYGKSVRSEARSASNVFLERTVHATTGKEQNSVSSTNRNPVQYQQGTRVQHIATVPTSNGQNFPGNNVHRDSQQSKSKRPTPPGGNMKDPLSYSQAVAAKSKPASDETTNSNTGKCSICLDDLTNPKTLHKCNHTFCTECIDKAFKHQSKCPICSMVYGTITGNQPLGNMSMSKITYSLPGHGNCGTIKISYNFSNGTQGPNHPNPGRPYRGTSRVAYLPDNDEGRTVFKLLQKAFLQKLTFTIGRSSTTGMADVIVWNDIHHKTNATGGPTNYGYPDPTYLKRVQEELAAKGIEE